MSWTIFQRSRCRSHLRSDHRSNHGSDHGSEHKSDDKSDHRSDHRSEHRSDHRSIFSVRISKFQSGRDKHHFWSSLNAIKSGNGWDGP